MHANIDVLMELVKFDMQQIQAYREIILKIAVMCIVASCSVFAFLGGKDHRIDAKNRRRIILSVNVGLLLVIVAVWYQYFAAIDASRACLDKREDAVKAWIASNGNYQITTNDVYPELESTNNASQARGAATNNPSQNAESGGYKPHMPSYLEKMPLIIALVGVVASGVFECWMLTKQRREPKKTAPGAAKPQAADLIVDLERHPPTLSSRTRLGFADSFGRRPLAFAVTPLGVACL